MRRSAFTLVEILIVVVILGIVAGVVVPSFSRSTDEAAKTATLNQLLKIRKALDVYYVRFNNHYPASIEEGEGTWGELLMAGGDYLRDLPRNQWVPAAARRTIVFGAAPDTEYHANYGWIFNPATGELWAAAFDANDQALPKE
jgi:general secretion pathway protein G